MTKDAFVEEYMNNVGTLACDLQALADTFRSPDVVIPTWMVTENRGNVADLLEAAAVYVRLAFEVKMRYGVYGGGK